MDGGESLAFITAFGGGFATIFGIFYLRTKENMAMIEKNMNPKVTVSRLSPYRSLKWALLLAGIGAGLFLAYYLDSYILPVRYITETSNGITNSYRTNDGVPAIYMGLIALGGGLGLFISYAIERRWLKNMKELS